MTDNIRDLQRALVRAEMAAQINHEQWQKALAENDALKAEAAELAEALRAACVELEAQGVRANWTGFSNSYIAAVQRAKNVLRRRAIVQARGSVQL